MLDSLLTLIKGAPAETSLILVCFSVLVAMMANNRKVNLESMTSVGRLQNENMTAILTQNRELAEDLAALRKQFALSYENIDALHSQISDMRTHIVRLEALIVHYQTSCKDCDKIKVDSTVHQSIPYRPKQQST